MSTLWETAAGGKDEGGTLEIADYSMFSGSGVFVMFLRSDESPVSLGKGTTPNSETRDLSCFPSQNEAAQPDSNVNIEPRTPAASPRLSAHCT